MCRDCFYCTMYISILIQHSMLSCSLCYPVDGIIKLQELPLKHSIMRGIVYPSLFLVNITYSIKAMLLHYCSNCFPQQNCGLDLKPIEIQESQTNPDTPAWAQTNPYGSYLSQLSALFSAELTAVSMKVATLENPAGRSSHSSNLIPLPKEYVPSAHLLHTWFFISRYSPAAHEKAGKTSIHNWLTVQAISCLGELPLQKPVTKVPAMKIKNTMIQLRKPR